MLPKETRSNFMLDRYLDQMTVYTGTVIDDGGLSPRTSISIHDANELDTVQEFRQLDQDSQLISEHHKNMATETEHNDEASQLNDELLIMENKILEIVTDGDASTRNHIPLDRHSEIYTARETEQLEQDSRQAPQHHEHMVTRTEGTSETPEPVNNEARHIVTQPLLWKKTGSLGQPLKVVQKPTSIRRNSTAIASPLDYLTISDKRVSSTTTSESLKFSWLDTRTGKKRPGTLLNLHIRKFSCASRALQFVMV